MIYNTYVFFDDLFNEFIVFMWTHTRGNSPAMLTDILDSDWSDEYIFL